jgi:lipopolysaccharide transport system ATP-binding protein
VSNIAVQVENLSKRYEIGQRQRNNTLRDSLSDTLSTTIHRLSSIAHRDSLSRDASAESEERFIWALKDISFQVEYGEVVGIIGRNGAGKSTLLKILSRITEPTEGIAKIRGRVGTLLEVGTGFHGELTGRENIYLSGAILGMRKAEIDRRFDEIVAFAEVEKLIDTPVKHYSSGMYMRLAFAVAAHLEPEILLVDEVLAVGDTAFQQKCLGKMGDVAKEGRTVLYVSHNLGSLANLCPRAMLLVEGKKRSDGASGAVIAEYIAMGRQDRGERVWNDIRQSPGSDSVRLHAVRVISGGEYTADIDIQHDIKIEIEFWNLKPGADLSTSIHLIDKMGVPVLATSNMHSANLIVDDWFGKPHPVGLYRATCTLPGNFLNEGVYSVNAIVLTGVTQIEAYVAEAVSFNVHDTGAMRKEYGGHWLGVVRPKLAWQTEYLTSKDSITSREQSR